MDLGLKGKVAAVTGGSEGVGKATVLRLAQEGAKVAFCARREGLLQETAAAVRAATGAEVHAMSVDIQKQGEPERFIAETVKRFGRLDIVVNNAGREASFPFNDVNDDDWQADIDLKLFAAIRAIRAALPHLRASGAGRIVNITHVGAKQPRARSCPHLGQPRGGYRAHQGAVEGTGRAQDSRQHGMRRAHLVGPMGEPAPGTGTE